MEQSRLPPPTSARRTVRLSFTFPGRATRTEFATYILATLLISVPVSVVTGLVLPYDRHLLVGNVLAVLLGIPVPALLARRIHDQGRDGRLAWLALPGIALWLARTAISGALGLDARMRFDQAISLVDWLVVLSNIALTLLVILPGTAGENRYGADPRQRS